MKRVLVTLASSVVLVCVLANGEATAQERDRFIARQEAGQDNAALKLRLDDLERRMQDDATLTEKRLTDLHKRIQALERALQRGATPNPYLRRIQ